MMREYLQINTRQETYMDRCSIIIEDKNIHHALIDKTIKIIKEKYDCRFSVDQLNSFLSFSGEEKEYLKRLFSSDVNELIIWDEHHFYRAENVWEYSNPSYFDYSRTMRIIMRLPYKSKINLGTMVYTNDYHLLSNLWHAWETLCEDQPDDIYWKNRTYETNYAVVEFISHSLRHRVGESCRFDFEFIRAFVEARHDYFNKKIKNAIFGIANIAID